MRGIVGGVVRYCDLVAKIKIAKFFSLACLLVIRENLCSQKFPAIRYSLAPRRKGGEGERVPGINCLCMHYNCHGIVW